MENNNGILVDMTSEDKFLSYCEMKYPKYLELLDSEKQSELNIKLNNVSINIKSISKENLFKVSFACLPIYVSKIIDEEKFNIENILKKLDHIISLNITKDTDIFIPNLDDFKKSDLPILNEYIYIFVERSLEILRTKKTSSSNSVVGISEDDRIEFVSNQLKEISENYEEILKEENSIFIDADFDDKEFMIEYFEINEEEELSNLKGVSCPYCGECGNNILNLGIDSFYCYDCEKDWKKSKQTTNNSEIFVRK